MSASSEVEKFSSDTSSNEARSHIDAPVTDNQTALLGQAPLPIQGGVTPAPIQKLDSRVPKEKEVDGEDNDEFKHLPEHEARILKRQVDVPPVKVTFKTLFRYATRNDILIIVLSSICAIVGGAIMPLMTVVFGKLAGTFQGFFLGTISPSAFS
ncbi:hypothetical protein LTR28_012011, partial [Elasticomyces elasticus]